MFSKTTFALAIIVGTASGALAATRQHSTASEHGAYVRSDPNGIRRDINRGGRPERNELERFTAPN